MTMTESHIELDLRAGLCELKHTNRLDISDRPAPETNLRDMFALSIQLPRQGLLLLLCEISEGREIAGPVVHEEGR